MPKNFNFKGKIFMSMPKFPELPDMKIESSVAQILSSIALEEIAISHILNAEGEKIQYILGTLDGTSPSEAPTINQVLEINESVKDMLGTVSMNQMFLMGKMSMALNAYKESKKNGGSQEPESLGSYISMIHSQEVNTDRPIIFDKTVTEKGVTKNADNSFTLNKSKYWKVNFGAHVSSTVGISEIMFYVNDILVTNLPIYSSTQYPYSMSFIVPAKAGSVLKVLCAGHPIRLEMHEANAYLTIQSLADY